MGARHSSVPASTRAGSASLLQKAPGAFPALGMPQDPKEGLHKARQGVMAPVPRERGAFLGQCGMAGAVLEARAAPEIPVIPPAIGVSGPAAHGQQWNGPGMAWRGRGELSGAARGPHPALKCRSPGPCTTPAAGEQVPTGGTGPPRPPPTAGTVAKWDSRVTGHSTVSGWSGTQP